MPPLGGGIEPGFTPGDRVLAMPPGLVGCAEQLLLGDDRLVPIDDGLSNDAAVISQPMATFCICHPRIMIMLPLK